MAKEEWMMKADWALLGSAAAGMLVLPLLVLLWSGTPLGTANSLSGGAGAPQEETLILPHFSVWRKRRRIRRMCGYAPAARRTQESSVQSVAQKKLKAGCAPVEL